MIQSGIDRLLADAPAWKKARLALVTNHAAFTSYNIPVRLALQQHAFNLVRLFSPEHGLDVKGVDGQPMNDGMDPLSGLPVTSLYGHKLSPATEDLSDVDFVLFDIPDIGARFYTYLWTMTHVMESCAANGKTLVVLDRPNPLSGKMDLAEGPLLEESQSSFIGRWSIPVRHSCTLGELARYFNETRSIKCNLQVITCEGWKRDMFLSGWDTTFVAPSPAICHVHSMLLYPGLCLLEATNISEGRGTEHSFRAVGAPWIDGKAIETVVNNMALDEVTATATHFKPREGKYAGQQCGGVYFEVVEPDFFQPVFFGLLLVKFLKDMYPQWFEWSPYPTLVNPTGKQHLDKLLGIAESEKIFDLPRPKFIATARRITGAGDWAEQMAPFLLY